MPSPGDSRTSTRSGGRRRGWRRLTLRAQGVAVLAVPLAGLVVGIVLLVAGMATAGAPALLVATLCSLVVAAVVGAATTLLYTRDLSRRLEHLTANAERLARDAELDPAQPGSDELALAERTLARAAGVLATRQRQLEAARTSLEHLVSAGPMVMFEASLTTTLDDEAPLTLEYVSSNSARVMGHSPLSLLSDRQSFVGLVHPDDLPELLAAARRAIGDARRQLAVEFRVRHLDGSWRWMESTVRGHESDPYRVLGYAVDISARREAESARRESESRLSAFLDNSTALIALKDPFGRYQFANRALTELLGGHDRSIVGTDDFDHWPEAAPMLRARDQRVLVNREPMQFEEIIHLADGPHTFLSVKFPLLDEDGVPVAVGSIATDITEVKEALANVAARERVLSTVIGASPDVITILEADGTIRTTSVAFERIFGFPTRTLVDQSLFDVVHPDDREGTRARFELLSRGERERVTLRFRGRTADGVWVTIESHAQVITGTGGDSDGIVMVSRDITDQIALEEALRSAKEQAERASTAKSEFLSRVSHELRTPLNAMLGFTQLLELEDLDQESSEYVDQISRAGEHLLALINEVLDIARIETDHMNLRIEPLPAPDAVREVLELTAPLAARAGVALHGPPADTTRPTVLADRQRLLQVLLNLVSNAIKYNHPGGRVDVATVEVGGRVRMTVHDTGPGLDDEQIARLFVPFDRLGLEHTGVEGTGVGLALSRGLTERMDGTLSVHSTPGLGSSFVVELPAAPLADGDADADAEADDHHDIAPATPAPSPVGDPHTSFNGGRT